MSQVLDAWIKQIMPLSPHHCLQESLLHILQVLGKAAGSLTEPCVQEQDDALVEGLLCLLDTHMALYPPGTTREPEQVLQSATYHPSCRVCWTRTPPVAS